jgi:thiamine-phosphate pyrophosphorylase
MAGGAFLDLADTLAGDAHRAGATLIINDRADIALLSGAHGVHVGQTDLTPDDVRRVVGASAIVGLSTHSQAQWDAAVRLPISYVAVGPTFTTETKVTGYAALGLDVVAEVAAVAATRQIPTVAIGGITLGNARSVVEAGAASVAVISDLLNGDPERRCREFLRALA